MGPLVAERQRDRVEDYIRLGLEEGAKLVLGGDRPPAPVNEHGFFVAPTVFTDVTPQMRIVREDLRARPCRAALQRRSGGDPARQRLAPTASRAPSSRRTLRARIA